MLTDISKIVSNNSYTIKLPKTANNLRTIECAHIPSAVTNFPYLKHAGTLVRDGVEIIRDANVVLLSVGEQIEIALSWGNVMNFDTLVNDGKSLQDLSYGMVAGVDYTNWVKQSVQTPQFPKIEYGFKDKETSVWYHPVVTVKWIMDKIASEYGITFEFPDDRVEMMERMKIPLLTRKDAQKQIDENTKIAMVSGFRQEQATFPHKALFVSFQFALARDLLYETYTRVHVLFRLSTQILEFDIQFEIHMFFLCLLMVLYMIECTFIW